MFGHLALVATVVVVGVISSATAFVPLTSFRPTNQRSSILRLSASKATLDEQTKWRLRFVLNGVPTAKGRKVDSLFVVEAQFVEEVGYEPPQGIVRQILSENEDEEGAGKMLEISNSYWKLSEDPDDRKDGLWVWGLFKEPLYPFMLLQLETKEVALPGEEGDSIKPLKLYAQINHSREKEEGVVLQASALSVRELETMKADPFGAATVEIYDEVNVGQLNIQPISSSVQA
uniref:Uncharacterized protein n=1 Tax=Odontella aurita TaxID=265563 RepID=A0A7S4JLM2_9STRA|mmetsp:Transcript_48857/g.147213  ORF Transcript_48857/g.147213 Transcript_48857/m.147213 type:complete len:231 (+) Transcript_48857:403-1095(+)|eukprot:CAMPEP_0113543348 /NCGR_PEP_ID=MMETSP0015_2-20120614/10109_1 /TAXON_ID=2838 /ORGANISM="Odontella" /LENGTH=230 /DNA_ID=CAMNT_0000443499 /DNA_START=384 /DNA_END=1076 /DNA_ORIENTATION=+ /assembly_acc=CAM_ASM_000160